MALSDSAARGLALRLIREETERIKHDIQNTQFNAPTKPGRWYKAVVRDMKQRMKGAIVVEGEAQSGKRAQYILVACELFDDYLGFTTYRVNKATMRVEHFDAPVALTVHLIQRLLQDGMKPNIRSLTDRVRDIYTSLIIHAHSGEIPHGKEFNLVGDAGIAGCVMGKTAIVVRTWVPRDSMTDERYRRYVNGAKANVHP